MYLSLSLFFSLPSVNMVTLEKLLERTDISKVTMPLKQEFKLKEAKGFQSPFEYLISFNNL